MTSLAHTLVGVSVGLWSMPVMDKVMHRMVFMFSMIAVASLPDWPIPGWGHYRLNVSHSIVVNGGMVLGIAVGLHGFMGSKAWHHKRVAVGMAVTWLSHFLLDTLYADSSLGIFWPLSDTRVSLPIPWLTTLPHVPPPFDGPILRIFFMEALTFLPLVAVALVLRARYYPARRL